MCCALQLKERGIDWLIAGRGEVSIMVLTGYPQNPRALEQYQVFLGLTGLGLVVLYLVIMGGAAVVWGLNRDE